jgi:hypothetical protein
MRNKLIGIALGLLIAAVLISLQSRPRHHAIRLLAEDDGAIKTIALHYTRDAAEYSGPCYRAFLSQIDPGAEVIAVCGDDADAASFRSMEKSLGQRMPRNVKIVVLGKPITGWCKDRFLVSAGPPSLLIHPKASDTGLAARTNDSLVAPLLGRLYPRRFRSFEIPMVFDAGDILATRSKIIVSDSLWIKNGRPKDFKRWVESLFDGGVIWLRGVPDHHIGMYAVPLDDKTVVVGDPDLARTLWKKTAERALGKPDFSEKTTAEFRRAAEQLKSAGYRVIRVPLAPIAVKTYITYTNGVFEKRGGHRIVYMPTYGVAALDSAARKAYESADYEARPIPVCTVYRFRGTIGCLINVVERG